MRRVNVQNKTVKSEVVNSISATTTSKVPIYENADAAHSGVGDLIYDLEAGIFKGRTATGWTSVSGVGGVSSVILEMPANEFTVTGSPITSFGTLSVSVKPQPAKTVWAGPTTGAPDVPSFRALSFADIATGIVSPSNGGTGVANASTFTITGSGPVVVNTTGSTNVTLPVTGTLASLAGAEAFTNKVISDVTNNVTANSLFYNSGSGIINVADNGLLPSAGSVLMALSSGSARWAPVGSSGSVSMVYVKPQQFGDATGINVPATQTLDGASEFYNVADALAYIAGLTAAPDYNNRYIIYIYPGVYTETVQLVVPSFVYLVGQCMETVRIQPPQPVPATGFGTEFITFGLNSGASFLTIQNVDPTDRVSDPDLAHSAVLCRDVGDYVLFHKIEIENCQKGMLCESTSAGPVGGSFVYLEYVDTNFGSDQWGLKCTTNGQALSALTVSAESFFTYNHCDKAFWVDGQGCELILSGCSAQTGDGFGIGVHVTRSAILNAQSVYIERYGTAINVPEDGGAPDVVLEGIIMEGCDQELVVPNLLCTGHYTGYTEYTKTFIEPTNPFFITNQDTRVVTVAKQGGNFTSVSTALAAITTSTSTNRFVVYVGPGIFDEASLDLSGKQGISIIGYSQSSTTLRYNGASSSAFITAGGDTILQNLTIQVEPTVGNTNTAILYNGAAAGKTLKVYGCVFMGSATSLANVINCDSTLGQITFLMQNCIFNTNTNFVNGLTFRDTAGPITFGINGLIWGRPPIGDFTKFINVISISSISNHISANIVNVISGNTTPTPGDTSIGLYIQGSTNIVAQNSVFSGFGTGLNVTGTNVPKVTITGTVIKNCLQAITITNAATVGVINVVAERRLITVNASITDLAIRVDDPADSSLTIVGDIYQGSTFAETTDISTQIQRTASLGILGDYTLSKAGSGNFNVVVPGGAGYLMVGTALKYVTWSGNPAYTVPSNTVTWLYINSTGSIVTTGNSVNYIFLGGVKTNGAGIVYFYQVSRSIDNLATNIVSVLENIGPIVGSGLTTTQGIVPLTLNVDPGVYSYGSKLYNVSAGSAITMTRFFGASNSNSGTTVPVQWDNSGTLVTLTSGQWAKHSLYIVGNGSLTGSDPVYLMVYSKTTFASQVAADIGPLPTPPAFFTGNVCRIASLIINDTGTTLVIGDIRPSLSK